MEETKIGQLVIDLKIKTEALEKGLETAKKKLEEIEKQNEQVKSSNKGLDASFIAMSASIVASLAKITSAIDDGVTKYNNYVNSMGALEKTVRSTKNSMIDVKKAMEDVNKFKFIDDADLSKSMQNLLRYGFTVEQASEMLKVMQDAAVGNKEPQYELSEAIKVTTDGIRMENSVLSNAVGVEKNISQMHEDYAKKIGKTTDALTQAEKVQAVYNGFMDEAGDFIGSAAEMANTYQGQQAQLNAVNLELSRTIGETMIPALSQYNNLWINIKKNLTEFISNNKTLSSGVMTFTVTMLTLTGVVKVLVPIIKSITDAFKKYTTTTTTATTATKSFMATLKANPVSPTILAISTLVSVYTAAKTAAEEKAKAQQRLNEVTETYNKLLEGTYGYSDEEIAKVEAQKQAVDEQIALMEQKIEIEEKMRELMHSPESLSSKIDPKWGLLENGLIGEIVDLVEDGVITDLVEDYQTAGKSIEEASGSLEELNSKLSLVDKELKKSRKENANYGNSIDELKSKQEEYNKYLEEAGQQKNINNALDTESMKAKKREASTAVETAKSYQELFRIYKEGEKGTKEWENAVEELGKKFPEAVSANGIIMGDMERFVNDMAQNAGLAWNNTQSEIEQRITEIEKDIANCNPELDPNGTYAKSIADKIKVPTNEVIGVLQTALDLYNTLLGKKSDEVGGGGSTYTPPKTTSSSGSASKSYSNERLDNYKKEIEHKKALDQISLKEEIAMYEKALKNYAKTQDEKWELEEKIYDLRKEAQEKEYSDYTAFVEHKKAIGKKSLKDEINDYEWAYKNLAKTVEQKQELEEKLYDLRKELQEDEYNNYISEIQYKKSMDKISLKQEIEMYEKALKDYAKTAEQKKEIRQTLYELNKELAQKEKTLLDQQTEDYEIYMQKQKKLRGAAYDVNEQTKDYDKIIEMHKNYLNQIMKDERLSLEERKELYREELATIRSYEEQKRNLRVESIDNTVSQLTNAITKQLEEMQEKDKELIDKNLEAVEKWKNARIDAINEEYDARIEAINKELELLNKSEQQKTRDEEDAEHERKKKRLEELIAFEHDAVTKANYQKELDKLIEEYQKTLDKRALDDKKEALNAQKDLLKEEQDSKVQAVEEEAEKQTEIYDKQLEKLEAYYDEQIDMAQQTAEKMLLNVGKNQDKILSLLKKYGDKYEITGQSLGEKLAQGINEGLAGKIEKAIGKIQDTIDKNIEKKIKEWTASNYKYEPKTNKPEVKTVNVTQINNIEQNPEMPSETHRKLNNVSKKLATEIAGM